MVERSIAQPAPDGEAIADVVRERLIDLMRRGRPVSLDDVDEIVQLERLLFAHIAYVNQEGRA